MGRLRRSLAGEHPRAERLGAVRALAFVGAVLLGVLTIYCFWLLLSVGAFWVVRLEFIVELFEGVYQAGR